MRIFYDTEFIDDGETIDLVSIGMTAEDGRELYVVSAEFDQLRLSANKWLIENVWPHLPQYKHPGGAACRSIACSRLGGHLDVDHPDVRPRKQIARMVADFITGDDELWACYGAYDHVALAQLFGDMSHLPKHIPMLTHDLMTVVRMKVVSQDRFPPQPKNQHNALADARWNMQLGKVLGLFETP